MGRLTGNILVSEDSAPSSAKRSALRPPARHPPASL